MLDFSLKGMHLGICKDEITEIRLLVFLFFKVLLVLVSVFLYTNVVCKSFPLENQKSSLFLDVISVIPVLPWTPSSLACGSLHEQCKWKTDDLCGKSPELFFLSLLFRKTSLFCDVAFTAVCVCVQELVICVDPNCFLNGRIYEKKGGGVS